MTMQCLPILVPTVAMPTPRLCLRMLYLISHIWNSNYVISQQRVAMTAAPCSRVAHTLGDGEGEGPSWLPSTKPQPRIPLIGEARNVGLRSTLGIG